MSPQNNNQNMGPMAPVSPKSKYSTFYLIMLILATIGAIFGFFGFFASVVSIVFYFSEKPIMAVIGVINIALGIASIVSLILLYMKKRAGFIMRMLLIGLSLMLTIFSMVATKSDFIERFNKGFDSSYGSSTESKTAEEEQAAASIKGFVNQYGGGASVISAVFSVLLVIIFNVSYGLLWFFAWKSQLKHDAEFSGSLN
jgi:hypothetical protein